MFYFHGVLKLTGECLEDGKDFAEESMPGVESS
jgi:hypothetical protein